MQVFAYRVSDTLESRLFIYVLPCRPSNTSHVTPHLLSNRVCMLTRVAMPWLMMRGGCTAQACVVGRGGLHTHSPHLMRSPSVSYERRILQNPSRGGFCRIHREVDLAESIAEQSVHNPTCNDFWNPMRMQKSRFERTPKLQIQCATKNQMQNPKFA